MFKSNTVVVIGAGASFEAGLPIGSILKEQISKLTDLKFERGDLVRGSEFVGELKRCERFQRDVQRMIAACSKVSAGIGFVSSVDNFLEIHADDEDVQVCAKCAITYLISKGEQASKLAIDRSKAYSRLSSSKLANTWYQGLAHVLFEKVPATAISSAFEKVDFISFNYDRCLEWFLYQCLMGIYAIDSSKALKLLSSVDVRHPYGQIGDKSWQTVVNFFGEDLSSRIALSAEKIRTYTEKCEATGVDEIRGLIEGAENIIFLGFAFHPQNMSLLQPQGGNAFGESKNIYFTSHGMSENDAEEINMSLKHYFTPHRGKYNPANVTSANLKCFEFLERYKRTLSA
ncbi:MAG: hypothetical protein WC026_00080 [Hyphomicrobium sp.]|uniref:hypothetical protein n=1 Tax=Hyphomicrobium sp. TaxID=82 RepID=UPI00356A2CE0